MNRPELDKLLELAKARWDAMTPEQRQRMQEEQVKSWVRGELGMGSDADEARERAKYRDKG